MTVRTAGNGTRSGNRSFPFGAWGVGALCAALGGLAGLLIPMGWIEEVSWQLYLDQLIAAARPPLGPTARLAAVLALALALGVLGWIGAWLLKVRPAVGGIDSWLSSMRGGRADDEEDAPVLRPADRHPDAPARRPFSATRDVPVSEAPAPVAAWSDEDEGDELLLDAQFDEVVQDVSVSEESRAARWQALEQVDSQDVVDPLAAPMPVGDQGESVIAPDRAATPAESTAPVAAAPAAGSVTTPEPFDLSVAKLDELIARLEAGLSRREAAFSAPASLDRDDTLSPAPAGDPSASEPTVQRGAAAEASEPSFPQDPALAAALATLRRMNRAS